MRKLLNSLFGSSNDQLSANVPEGKRVYAVGDIHGRADLFEQLIIAIERDDAASKDAETTIILLGDLVDRGPESSKVIELARIWQDHRSVRILAGNHEEMFLMSFEKLDVLRSFLRHGGRETLMSYGYDWDELIESEYEEVHQRMQHLVPQADRDFMGGFEEQIRIGDYLFVHAGIDPEAPYDDQKRSDMLWIREPFLSYRGELELTVVHGHTISDEPEVLSHRIGIDTGAFQSGRLTALRLEGTGRDFLVASETDGVITVEGVKEI